MSSGTTGRDARDVSFTVTILVRPKDFPGTNDESRLVIDRSTDHDRYMLDGREIPSEELVLTAMTKAFVGGFHPDVGLLGFSVVKATDGLEVTARY